MSKVSYNMKQDLLRSLKINHVLAQRYGFTEEELDFIIDYDIKYQMGKDADED